MRGLGQEYQNATASNGGDFETLPPGGYVCKITSAKDYPNGNEFSDKPYLEIVYDIAEGEHAGFYNDDWGKAHEWAHSTRWYYTPAALGMFKGNLKAVDDSNGTSFEDNAVDGIDERRLAGCLVGMIIGEEEYASNTGETRIRLNVRGIRPAATIREGRFKVPELKKLAANEEPLIPSKPENTNLEDLPF